MAVSFKQFVTDLCEAVASASESLRKRDTQILDTYFQKSESEGGETYIPNMVTLEAPTVDEEGKMAKTEVEVPVISLVPQTSTKMRKLTMKLDMQLYEENGELKVDLANDKRRHSDMGKGTLEITLSPEESSEGLQSLIESYENLIKNQLQ